MWTHKPKNEPGMAMLSVIPGFLLVDFEFPMISTLGFKG